MVARMTFEGTVLMITGASSGIGLRSVQRYAEQGARAIACDISATANPRTDVIYFRHDVTDETAWEAAVAEAIDRFGRLDALVNRAGIVLMGNVVDLDITAFKRIMAINAEGTFLGMKHAMRAMLPRGGARS